MPYARALRTSMPGSSPSIVSPSSPWSPVRDSQRPSPPSSIGSLAWSSRQSRDDTRRTYTSSYSASTRQPERTVSPRVSFETPVWDRPVRALDIPESNPLSPTQNDMSYGMQSSLPRRAATVAVGSYVSPIIRENRSIDYRPREDSVRYSDFEHAEDMSMFAAAMTGLDAGWSLGPSAYSAPEPLSPTVLPSPEEQRNDYTWPSASRSHSHHQSYQRPQPSPPITPDRAPSPAFSFEDQPTSHIEEYPDSHRSFAAALTGMSSADARDGEDELPDYAQSQLEAATATRRQALLRAAELERRWTASRTKRK